MTLSILLFVSFVEVRGSSVHPRNVGLEDLTGFMKKSEMPSTGKDWMSLSKGVEFQMSPEFENDDKLKNTFNRMLNGEDDEFGTFNHKKGQHEHQTSRRTASDSTYNPYSEQTLFVDGAETYYSAYAQAWRYVGYYVDCNADEEERRRLGGDEGGCVRYLLWAAYVDPYYGGNGLYEYQFYDRDDEEWTSYCADEDYCRKMDCHESDTHYQLMGFFKHADFDDWVEQLFKHEGVCIWTEDESDFMYEMEELLPKGCYQTYHYDDEANKISVYYGLMPEANGDVTLGLYTDYMCSQVYGGDVSVWEVIGNGEDRRLREKENNNKVSRRMSEDDQDLEETYEAYNSAFSIFKICQPCIAYDLSNGMECDDDAGYTNVNQCMKFRTQCEMGTATMEDVAMATEQGSTTSLSLMSGMVTTGSDYTKYVNNFISINDEVDDNTELAIFVGSIAVLAFGLYSLSRAHYQHRNKSNGNSNSRNTPLMNQGGNYA